jgi:flagellar protein FliS
MNHARRYLESKVRTASSEELFLMLFDGAIRFCEQAKARFGDVDFGTSHELLVRAQKIVLELVSYHRPEDMPQPVYRAVADLYDFVYNRLVRANLERKLAYVEDAQKVLVHLRETWSAAIDINRRERFPELKNLQMALESAASAGRSLALEG